MSKKNYFKFYFFTSLKNEIRIYEKSRIILETSENEAFAGNLDLLQLLLFTIQPQNLCTRDTLGKHSTARAAMRGPGY